jgi:hypothetical protein
MTEHCNDVSLKRELLSNVYEAYEEIVEGFDVACRRDCSACCTSSVFATTLEALLIIESQESAESSLFELARSTPIENRPSPGLTINQLAKCCLERKEPPPEGPPAEPVPCPFRQDDGCPIYEARPFHCRGMFSSQLCDTGGEAVMSPVIISLNGVFEQVIEHIDRGGNTGNMLDLLGALEDPQFLESYKQSGQGRPSPRLLIAQPNPGFIVPPQHRQQVAAALASLWKRTVRGLPFRDAMHLGCYTPIH